VYDEPAPSDTRFSLPACDDPPSTEIGVIAMGLPVEQLLAGLGIAALADDPASVTLLVDQVRHGGEVRLTMEDLVAAGSQRWRAAQPGLAAAGPQDHRTASLRNAWAQAYGALDQCEVGEIGPATALYLTACWLRAQEIDVCTQATSETSMLPQQSRSTPTTAVTRATR
jgi:hypothetical protein